MTLCAKFNAPAGRKEQPDNVVTLAFTAASDTTARPNLRRMAGQLGKRFGAKKPE